MDKLPVRVTGILDFHRYRGAKPDRPRVAPQVRNCMVVKTDDLVDWLAAHPHAEIEDFKLALDEGVESPEVPSQNDVLDEGEEVARET